MSELTPLHFSLKRSQRGATLIEVLVSILVVSLGVLAMAGLLATATRFGKTSEYRSIATLWANDLGDRMRANFEGKASYSTPSNLVLASGPTSMPAPDCKSAACSSTEMATYDLAEWQAGLYASLPRGTGYVAPSDGGSTLFDVWIVWQDPDAEGTSVISNASNNAARTDDNAGCPKNFSTDGAPRCMYFRVGL